MIVYKRTLWCYWVAICLKFVKACFWRALWASIDSVKSMWVLWVFIVFIILPIVVQARWIYFGSFVLKIIIYSFQLIYDYCLIRMIRIKRDIISFVVQRRNVKRKLSRNVICNGELVQHKHKIECKISRCLGAIVDNAALNEKSDLEKKNRFIFKLTGIFIIVCSSPIHLLSPVNLLTIKLHVHIFVCFVWQTGSRQTDEEQKKKSNPFECGTAYAEWNVTSMLLRIMALRDKPSQSVCHENFIERKNRKTVRRNCRKLNKMKGIVDECATKPNLRNGKE